MRGLLRFLLACLALCAPCLQAHEFWLLPATFAVPAGAPLALGMFVGQDFNGDAVAFSSQGVAAFSYWSEAGRSEVRARTVPGATTPLVSVRIARPGAQLFALDSHPSFIELPAETFNAYLRLEGLDGVLRAREEAGLSAAPGRERYRRNIKTLVRAGEGGEAVFATRTGQKLELVPDADTTRLAAPAELGIRVFFEGRPLPGALLKLWQRGPAGLLALQVRTDGAGRARLVLPQPGIWMASVVHMVPAAGTPGVDWDSYWGNLTFALSRPDQVSNAPRK